MNVKRIAILGSYDWSLRAAMKMFMDYLDPVVRYRKKEFKIELTRIMARPVRCGHDLSPEADLVVDRCTHWSEYYRNWCYQALNSGVQMVNNTFTFDNYNKHITYDIMARAMHPADRFPTTVLLPSFGAFLPHQLAEQRWGEEQEAIIKHTKFGWDPERRHTDWTKVKKAMEDYDRWVPKSQRMRSQFYPPDDFLRRTMEEIFHNKYPVFLKKVEGGGGSDVHKIESLQELYEKFDETGGRSFHLQEGVVDYDVFVRCMGIGPLVLPMRFLPDTPLHEHYGPDKLRLERALNGRLENYVKFINSYHRWAYNSYEAVIRAGQIFPIDFANGVPDSNFTSLHVHFPWLIVSLVKWLSFCAVTGKDMRMDMEHSRYLRVLNDPKRSQVEKYEFCARESAAYFETEKFLEFAQDNFPDLEERIVAFYDEQFEEIIDHAITWSDFPASEHDQFRQRYKGLMDGTFRKDPKLYLTTVVYAEEAPPAELA